MDIVEKINNRLTGAGMTWSDLARKMSLLGCGDFTVERVNNWKKRGIPARQIKNVAAALGMQRHELDGDESTQLREITQEQAEVLAMWDLLLSSQREQVKQWAAYTRDVLSEKVEQQTIKVGKNITTIYTGVERRGQKTEHE